MPLQTDKRTPINPRIIKIWKKRNRKPIPKEREGFKRIKKINFFVDILEYDLKKNHITPYYLSLTVIYNLRILSA